MWIKICGLTSEDAVAAAVEAGADALGFVFAPSKRQVSASRAAALTRAVPSRIARIAVMQHPSQALVDEVWSVFAPTLLQTDFEDLSSLKLPERLPALPVVRGGKAAPDTLPARVLFEGPVSGTGRTADWTRAAELAQQTQLILAGGLNAQNVASAIAAVRPFGVDVSSGVESAPGVKDARKIAEFVAVVRNTREYTPPPGSLPRPGGGLGRGSSGT
jgi:phosphoribosylanthranilate isomerase